MQCPNCGSDHVDRQEVDGELGTYYGPWICIDCGRDEDDEIDDWGLDWGDDDSEFEEYDPTPR